MGEELFSKFYMGYDSIFVILLKRDQDGDEDKCPVHQGQLGYCVYGSGSWGEQMGAVLGEEKTFV